MGEDQRTARRWIDEASFVETSIVRLSKPLEGSDHPYKYSLALIVGGQCVLRYDNERGKGDHRHEGDIEQAYVFTTLSQLLSDFKSDVRRKLQNG
ncbi:hypothetical protein F3N42_14575 [Marinihelvus fidelis]|uniref:Uncharacterized protein n=1 Tax=Marinihelvus fidelis TaxID=2613842 RepID=A0A5N0T8Y8_9GAMM|nr:DUF6516 family protein [Marinihelvus fidelis]KAA9129759.1 hypothetical protein F3N42_14575 [Marinihelvus fidelis]